MKITITKDGDYIKATVTTGTRRHTEKGLNASENTEATLLGDALNALSLPNIPTISGGEDLNTVLRYVTDAGYQITELSITLDT